MRREVEVTSDEHEEVGATLLAAPTCLAYSANCDHNNFIYVVNRVCESECERVSYVRVCRVTRERFTSPTEQRNIYHA